MSGQRDILEKEIAMSKAEIERLEIALGNERSVLRQVEQRYSDAAPCECEVCRGGIWDEAKPHRHENVFASRAARRQSKWFYARVIKRAEVVRLAVEQA